MLQSDNSYSPEIEATLAEIHRLEPQASGNPEAQSALIRSLLLLIQQAGAGHAVLRAGAQSELGTAYATLGTGDRTSNLTNAIAAYESALVYFTPETSVVDYAIIQKNLGNVYRKLPVGDPLANLTKAIAAYKEAARFFDPQTNPTNFALAQLSLGRAYWALDAGDRQANLQQSISCFQEALRFFTLESDPLNFAIVQNSLGNAYAQLLVGDQDANLRQAISCYQAALQVFTAADDPFDYAMVQNNIGTVYMQLPTDIVANIGLAIASFTEALRFRTPDSNALQYAYTQKNLGDAYRLLPTGDKAENLANALKCYNEALRFFSRDTDPEGYAMTQNNIGLAYADLPGTDVEANLKKALDCFTEVLGFYTPQLNPIGYGQTQANLGNVYARVEVGEHKGNLERALSCYKDALKYISPANAPGVYATIEANLSGIYQELRTGDQQANLTEAISCCKEALRYITASSQPFDYAMVQNNLGSAYGQLALGDRATNLGLAITCYNEALRFYTFTDFPTRYASTQTNLGNVYLELPSGDRSTNLTQAISCYKEALRVYTATTHPLDHGLLCNNLGHTYVQIAGTGVGESLHQAIALLREALQTVTASVSPLDYSMIQHNLGGAYAALSISEEAQNHELAIAAFTQALRFRTLDGNPYELRQTTRSLAQLYFRMQNWPAAQAAYHQATAAGERVYSAGLSAASRANEVAQNVRLYHEAAFTEARLGNPARALLLLEQGKTRLLKEVLRLRVARPDDVPDEAWQAFQNAALATRAATHSADSQLASMVSADAQHDQVGAYEARVQSASQANDHLNRAIESVRKHAPGFLQPLDMEAMISLLPSPGVILVAFCLTSQGSMVFVLGSDGDLKQIDAAGGFTDGDLADLLGRIGESGSFTGGWLGAYSRQRNKPTIAALQSWRETMVRSLAVISERLLGPALAALPEGAHQLLLLPSAGLFLLPLHAMPLPGSDTLLLSDRYDVRYAPSAGVLAELNSQLPARELAATGTIYAVINPQHDPRLIFAATEGTRISQLFRSGLVQIATQGNVSEVVRDAPGHAYVHFACHGQYNWSEPQQSGLALADGLITLADLRDDLIDLSTARLVTLSACETGITDVFYGSPEEYIGLPAGFLLAGAADVLCSLWAVPDISTPLLLARFYDNHLNKLMDLAAALSDAQKWLRQLSVGEVVDYERPLYDQASAEVKARLYPSIQHHLYKMEHDPDYMPFTHPYYWAAFTLNGLY